MQELKRHSNESHLLYQLPFIILSAYAVFATLYQAFTPISHLYLQLARPVSLSLVIITVLVLSGVFFGLHKILPYTAFEVFSVCAGIYFISACLFAPSPTIVIGYMILNIVVLIKLIRDKSIFLFFSAFCLICLLLKFFIISGANGQALQKFNYVIIDKDKALQKGLLIGLYVSLFITGVYAFFSKTRGKNIDSPVLKYIVFCALCFVTIFVSIIMAGKDLAMAFATYDKGLFTQMFEHMRTGLGPMTTLERDHWMSHFNVHVSPIFYLMLPFYMLYPKPETLEVLQVLLTMSGIIPFYLILKHLKFSNTLRHLCLLLFILMPTLTSAHLYGLHENCFLTPLLFWLILANLKQWRWRLIGILMLTLFIKEDSMIYIIAIGLFFLCTRQFSSTVQRKIFIAVTELLVPIVYFGLCLHFLNHYGDGSMTTRFTNFMLPGQTGLKDVVVNIITNPTYFFSAIFTFSKIKYIVTLLIALAFIPLYQKHMINYILLLPMLVINLLSDFQYQVDFGFQYHYGSSALLLFMAVLAIHSTFISEQRQHSQSFIYLLIAACVMSASIFMTLMMPSTYGIKAYMDQPDYFQAKKATLQSIPRDKKILSYGFYTTQLAGTKYLYDLDYHNDKKMDKNIDYVVVPRAMQNDQSPQSALIQQYVKAGYKEDALSSQEILILKSTKKS